MSVSGRCIELIDGGYTIVTASNRLARRLQQRYAERQLAVGRRAWETADILPWNAWLRRTWEAGAADSLPLNQAQAEYLWQAVVSDSVQRQQLLHPAGVARAAARAWSLAAEWKALPYPAGTFLNDDALAFQSWLRTFREECRAQHWLDPSSLALDLEARLAAGPGLRGSRIALAGFDALTPLRQAIMQLLEKSGWQTVAVDAPLRNQSAGMLAFPDRRVEIDAAARWARRLLDSEPALSIGIVAPDLAAARAAIETGFDDILLPGGLLEAPRDDRQQYQIAAGLPLSGYPLIASATAMLELVTGLPADAAGVLLRSPYQGDADAEAAGRSLLDVRLQRYRAVIINAPALLRLAGMNDADARPRLCERLQCVGGIIDAMPRSASAREWVEVFARILRAWDWPGPRTLSRAEFQCYESWLDALADFSGLDAVAAPCHYADALGRLKRLLAQRSFQPEAGETPVEILGLEGASFMDFDRIWMLGMDEDAWPRRAQADPFIPMRVQRGLGMPHASAEIELADARLLTARLVGSATEAVAGFARYEGDRPLRPSPLLAEFSPLAGTAVDSSTCRIAEQAFTARMIESFADEVAPPLALAAARGGSRLLSDQAACPFRAFARHRLDARGIELGGAGLSPAERGNLAHELMQRLWQTLGGQAGLLATGEAALSGIASQAADAALAAVAARRAEPTPRFAEIERRRLGALALAWLVIERQRTPFSVAALEWKRRIDFAGLELRARIDRVDEIAGRGRVVIDYKTGDATPTSWLGSRPDDAQMPLYAITLDPPPAALAYAHLPASGFSGVAEGDGILPVESAGTRRWRDFGTLEELLAYWRVNLEALAAEFKSGIARVSPKLAACRNCDLHALCRIHQYAKEVGNG